mgnify:CR=1 FL=1
MEQELPDRRFYMWRAVLAMIHADGVVTPHEVSFVNEQVRDVGFSQAQLYILSQDFKIPQDGYMMFAKITEEEDQYDFFVLARAVSWCDGDFARQEEHILDVLEIVTSRILLRPKGDGVILIVIVPNSVRCSVICQFML